MRIGLGIDVGSTKTLACAIAETGDLLAEVRLDSPTTRTDLARCLVQAAEQVIVELGQDRGEITGIGIGLPGLVDVQGVMHEAANMSQAEGLDVPKEVDAMLREVLGARLGTSPRFGVYVDNDSTCAAGGELAFGAARSIDDAVVITLGTGIGGGVIASGALVRGARGFAGEIGHMVVQAEGPRCGCGARGCWEQFASGTGLQRLARELIASGKGTAILGLANGELNAVRGEHVVEAAEAGDHDASDLIEVFTSYLAIGLSNLAEILDPRVIILGGGMSRSAPLLIAPAIEKFRTTRRGGGERRVEVALAELGERAGAFGGAALALQIVRWR